MSWYVQDKAHKHTFLCMMRGTQNNKTLVATSTRNSEILFVNTLLQQRTRDFWRNDSAVSETENIWVCLEHLTVPESGEGLKNFSLIDTHRHTDTHAHTKKREQVKKILQPNEHTHSSHNCNSFSHKINKVVLHYNPNYKINIHKTTVMWFGNFRKTTVMWFYVMEITKYFLK